jgi:hypothetical protein
MVILEKPLRMLSEENAIAGGMVENNINYYLHAQGMCFVDEFVKGLLITEVGVDGAVVPDRIRTA